MHNYRKLSRIDTSYVFYPTDYRSNPFQYFTIIDPSFFNADVQKSAYNISGYFNYSFLAFKNLSLNAGLRYDYTGFANQYTFSLRLNGSFQLNETNSITFGTGIFYQDPIYSEIADQPIKNKLKEEKVVQLVLGYKKYFTPDFKLTVESWYKTFDNMITRLVNGSVFENNAGNGRAYGLDVNLTKRLVEKIHGQIGYSYMQSKRNDHNGLGEYNFTFSQPHQLNILIGYKLDKYWISTIF